MRKLSLGSFVFYLCALSLFYNAAFAYADTTIEQARKLLLQKGLTIYQIDQEVERLTAEQSKVAQQIAATEQNIAQQNERIAKKREQAGIVLRSYYMGHRSSLWLSILTVDSLNDALAVFQYMGIIIKSDYRKLADYIAAYNKLQDLRAELVATQAELEQVKQQFLVQRERLVAMQQELDEQLAAAPPEIKPNEIEQQIDDLNQLWETKGKAMFNDYLLGLSEAMTQIPELIAEDPSTLTTDGLDMVFQITDQKLNDFLRAQNEQMFSTFAFRFEEGYLIVEGSQDDLQASIKGRYTLETEPENLLRFTIDEMTFNEFPLDETTRNKLQTDFYESLAFHPQRILPQIEATSVAIEPGKFTIRMKITALSIQFP